MPQAAELSPAPTASAFANADSVRTPVTAYINGDTIMSKYEAFKVMEQQIKDSYKFSSNRIDNETAKAQDEYNQLMKYAQEQGDKLSDADAKTMQDRMMQLEYQIQNLKAEEENKLAKKEAELNEQLMKDIREDLNRYCKEHHIDMVLNYMQLNQTLLYGSADFDITSSVIEGLNAEYALKQAQAK